MPILPAFLFKPAASPSHSPALSSRLYKFAARIRAPLCVNTGHYEFNNKRNIIAINQVGLILSLRIMSFFGDLVNSIGTDKSPLPPKPVQRQPITSSAAHSNPTPRPRPVTAISTPPVAGSKRKLEERDIKPTKPVEKLEKAERIIKPNPAPGLSSSVNQRSVISGTNGIRPAAPKLGPKPVPSTTPTNPSAPSRPPTQLSYAEKLARAKAAQQNRPQNPIGTIKHQATTKEKHSKLAERRRLEQEKDKADKKKQSDKSKPSKRTDRKRSASPVKKGDQAKVPRAPRPPLHAPASSYKGTIGTTSKKPREERISKRSRYDEYLATDEEDNSEAEDYDEGNEYESDQSSDMEAGMDDIDMEEAAALRAAKLDDAKELALENDLKRDKEERRRRLMAMAKKNSR